ncbi:MAG: hypothetical protein KGH78_02815 [Candidatus Micrarchaeota archaeon]|nr:hypothetical protein [Candidatus Micrarchaeota archaeon]
MGYDGNVATGASGGNSDQRNRKMQIAVFATVLVVVSAVILYTILSVPANQQIVAASQNLTLQNQNASQAVLGYMDLMLRQHSVGVEYTTQYYPILVPQATNTTLHPNQFDINDTFYLYWLDSNTYSDQYYINSKLNSAIYYLNSTIVTCATLLISPNMTALRCAPLSAASNQSGTQTPGLFGNSPNLIGKKTYLGAQTISGRQCDAYSAEEGVASIFGAQSSALTPEAVSPANASHIYPQLLSIDNYMLNVSVCFDRQYGFPDHITISYMPPAGGQNATRPLYNQTMVSILTNVSSSHFVPPTTTA